MKEAKERVLQNARVEELSYLQKYINYCYDEETEMFDLKRNNANVTAAEMRNIEHRPHIEYHLCKNGKGRHRLIKQEIEAFKDAKYDEESIGTITPTWFTDESQINNALELFFLSTTDTMKARRKQLNDWAKRFDHQEGFLSFSISTKSIKGYGTTVGADFNKSIPCHGYVIVFAHTAYSTSSIGSFVVYDLYPCFTSMDEDAIEKAKRDYERKQAQKGYK